MLPRPWTPLSTTDSLLFLATRFVMILSGPVAAVFMSRQSLGGSGLLLAALGVVAAWSWSRGFHSERSVAWIHAGTALWALPNAYVVLCAGLASV